MSHARLVLTMRSRGASMDTVTRYLSFVFMLVAGGCSSGARSRPEPAPNPISPAQAEQRLVDIERVPERLDAPTRPARILRREAYQPPRFQDAAGVERYATEAEYEAARGDAKFEMERVTYRSDDLAVVAYVYAPVEPTKDEVPAVVYNRGSYIRNDLGYAHLAFFHALGRAGFYVIAPAYRGSEGGEGSDEMGGADLNDLMAVVDVLEEIGGLDMQNLFLFGESRGGMMVLQAIRDGFPARAAATVGAFTDLEEQTQPPHDEVARTIWPDFDTQRAQIIERRSAVRWAQRITVPLLLIHGGADEAVAPSQTTRLAAQLPNEHEVVIFPGDDHRVSNHTEERNDRVIEWFQSHVI